MEKELKLEDEGFGTKSALTLSVNKYGKRTYQTEEGRKGGGGVRLPIDTPYAPAPALIAFAVKLIQGDTSCCSLGSVDIKSKVAF